MSRTIHHRGQKHRHIGEDWGSRYNCCKNYCGSTGPYPKALANKERRGESKKLIREGVKE